MYLQTSLRKDYILKYQIRDEEEIVFANQSPVSSPVNSASFKGYLNYELPTVEKRGKYKYFYQPDAIKPGQEEITKATTPNTTEH